MRIRWWLLFVFAGMVLAAVAFTLLSGTAQFLFFCLGVLVVALALFRRAGGQDYRRERPVPPGSGTPI